MCCFILLDLWMLLLISKWKFQTSDFYKNILWKDVRNKEKEGGKGKTIYRTDLNNDFNGLHPSLSTNTSFSHRLDWDSRMCVHSGHFGDVYKCSDGCQVMHLYKWLHYKTHSKIPSVPAMEIVKTVWTDLKWGSLIPTSSRLYCLNILSNQSQSPSCLSSDMRF